VVSDKLHVLGFLINPEAPGLYVRTQQISNFYLRVTSPEFAFVLGSSPKISNPKGFRAI